MELRRTLALRQRDTLPVAIQHVFDLDRRRGNANNFVTAIHNVALGGYKYVFALREEDFLGRSRLVLESKKF
jgi:hypothetical protein